MSSQATRKPKKAARGRKGNRKDRHTARGPTPSLQYIRGGPGPTITDSRGKVWRLGFNTQDAKARLEEIIRSYATRAALKERKELGGVEGEEAYSLFCDRKDSGAYHTFAHGWIRMLYGANGPIFFVWSLLQQHHPDATEAEVRKLLALSLEEVRAAVGEIAPDFFYAATLQVGVEKDATPEAVWAAAKQIADAMLMRFGASPVERTPDLLAPASPTGSPFPAGWTEETGEPASG